MARYTKNASTYIKRKRHQLIKDGAIIERDWTTLGERHVIEPGKQKVYYDGGFLFTESRIPSIKKRSNTEAWSQSYTLDDLGTNVNDDVNTIKLPISNDIRSYAYYGSAVELLRASLENIIKWFPGKAWSNNEYIINNVSHTVNSATINEIVTEIQNCYNSGQTSKFVSLINTDANFPEDFTMTIVSGDEFIVSGNTVEVGVSIALECIMDAESAANNISQQIETKGVNKALFSILSNGQSGNNRDFIVKFDDSEKINTDSSLGDIYEPNIFIINNPFNLDFFNTGVTFTKYENELRNLPTSWKKYDIRGREILTYDVWIKNQTGCESNYTVLYDISVTYAIASNVSRYNEFYTDYNVDDSIIIFTDTTDEDDIKSETDLDFIGTVKEYNSGHIYGLKVDDEVIWCTDIKYFTLIPLPEILTEYFQNLDGFERALLNRTTNPLYTCTLKTPVPKGNSKIGYYLLNTNYTFPSNGYCIICDGFGYNDYVNSLYTMANNMDENYTDNIWRNMTHESIKNFDWTYTKDYEEGDDEDNIFGGTRLQEVLRIYGRFFDDIKRYVDNISVANVITYDGQNNLPSAQLSDKASLKGWEIYSTKPNNDDNIILTSEFINDNITKDLSRWVSVKTMDNDLVFPGDSQSLWFNNSYPESVTQNIVDNHFMQNLILNTPSIFKSKGTKHSIEMVAALFGIGESDISFDEYYYTVYMRNADDNIYAYTLVTNIYDSSIYVDVSTDSILTLTEYINSLDHTLDSDDEMYITINGEYYELVCYTIQTLCEYINDKKIFVKNYDDDPYSGVPLKKIHLKNNDYIVPYFSQDKKYDGNVQFESNGGWGKWNFSTRFPDYYGYIDISNFSETLPYTPIMSTCNSLLGINKYTINGKSIYYVADITDIKDFTESDTSNASHYFKLIDANNPNLYVSWSNIPYINDMTEAEYETYCNERDEDTNYPIRPIYTGVTYNDYLLMQYLETIKFDNLGNNPHTGNGQYDYGNEYFNYINYPFYYAMNYYGFTEEYVKIMASYIHFSVIEQSGDKIVIDDYDELLTDDNPLYYMPSKLLKITFAKNNDDFKDYFKNIVFKYISQVIPSTTILVFQ